MSEVNQIIRWRQGKAVILARRPKPQSKATPAGDAAGASTPSSKVSISGGSTGTDATYTDRLKAAAKARANAVKHVQATATKRPTLVEGSGKTGANDSSSDALHEHVRAMLDYAARAAAADTSSANGANDPSADSASIDTDAAPAPVPSDNGAPAAASGSGSSDGGDSNASVGAWEERSYEMELQQQAAAEARAETAASASAPAPAPAPAANPAPPPAPAADPPSPARS